MTAEECRLRQLTGSYVIAPADKKTVVRNLCGLQAQFLSNAFHALRIRSNDYSEETRADGLVKNWTIRGTVHIFLEEDLPLFLSCNNGKDYRRNVWGEKTFWNQRPCWALTPEKQAYYTQKILEALAEKPRLREELKNLCREYGMTKEEEDSLFDAWGGGIREMCERGFMNHTVQEKKGFCLSPEFTPLPKEEAELEMARRYFTHMAPATIHDAMYFFRATAAQVKKWLRALPVSQAECEGRTYYFIENKNRFEAGIPDCIFLAGFDPLMLGYEKKESLYLEPDHIRKIFNLAGIVAPPVLLNGKVAGRWNKKGGRLSVEFFEERSPSELEKVRSAAETLWPDLDAFQAAAK